MNSVNPFNKEVTACELQEVCPDKLAPFGKEVAARELREMNSTNPFGKEVAARELQEVTARGFRRCTPTTSPARRSRLARLRR